ncbi:hypothetical protein BC497_29510 (plasmid) [Klebsiella variicola]|uniref:hypothetical protein n=1 Tax=Klebsiella variicola TaxID=244366 RepID=UPI000E360A25|nr:hypothetical protein [Klebsiella variicola]AXO74114.1 hypothetical protein BC497_29510 [Klebsiella variicola]
MRDLKISGLIKQFGLFVFLMVPVLAQAAGLDAGTSALSTFETWMYTILVLAHCAFLSIASSRQCWITLAGCRLLSLWVTSRWPVVL